MWPSHQSNSVVGSFTWRVNVLGNTPEGLIRKWKFIWWFWRSVWPLSNYIAKISKRLSTLEIHCCLLHLQGNVFLFHIGCSHPSSLGGPALGVRPSHVRIIMPRVHIRVTALPSHNSIRFWIKFSYKSFYGDHHILVTKHMAGFRKVGNSHFCNIVKPQANNFSRRLVRVRMESQIRSIWVWPKLSSLTSLNFFSFSDLAEITSCN